VGCFSGDRRRHRAGHAGRHHGIPDRRRDHRGRPVRLGDRAEAASRGASGHEGLHAEPADHDHTRERAALHERGDSRRGSRLAVVGAQPFDHRLRLRRRLGGAGVDINAGTDGYEATDLLKASGTAWTVVDRSKYCKPGQIPADVYNQGCTTN
jgi:hypothetical protein